MPEETGMPQEDYVEEDQPAPHRPWAVALLVVVLLVVGGGYALHERGVARQLAVQNDQVASALKQTQSQVDALTSRLNAAAAAEQARQAQEAAATAARSHPARHAAVRRRDDPRWKQMQDQLTAQQKAIESTQQDLSAAKTDLSGSIARTHEELVVLQKKGERNYYEFDLDKSKQFSRQGPVGLKLRKANVKHQYADLEMMVDDVAVTNKHVNLFQPVTFYSEDNAQPVELVINRVSKNHIHGYVSTAKYKASELAATATAETQADAAQKAQGPNGVSSPAPPSAATTTPPALRRRNQ